MKTILTIDFDIIMAPSIELYNDKVPKISWNELLTNPYMKLTKIDSEHYQRLTILIFKYFQKLDKNKIHFIESHEEIIQYFDYEEKYTIINIDHHHDIGYSIEDIKRVSNIKGTCANWVQYLYNKNCLNEYIWIHNINSKMPDEKLKDLLNIDYCLSQFDLNNLFTPDELVICLSSPWIPPEYTSLFYLWMDLANNYYNKHFDFEEFNIC